MRHDSCHHLTGRLSSQRGRQIGMQLFELIMKKRILTFFKRKTLLWAVVFLSGVLFVGAQSAEQYHKVGEWPGRLRGEFYDMKHQGDYLFASMINEKVLVALQAGGVDLTVSSRLDMDDGAYPYGIYIEGNTLYLGQNDGIQLVDITDPLNMQLGAKWKIAYTPEGSSEQSYYNVLDLYKKGNIFYLSTGQQGIRTVDMSDPENPVMLGSYKPTGTLIQAIDVSSDGNIIYGASMTDQIHIIDVSNPAEPVRLWANDDFLGNGFRSMDVALVDNLLYVPNFYYFAFGYGVISVVDVTRPTELEVVKRNEFNGYSLYHFSPFEGGAGTQAWCYLATQDANGFSHYWANLFGLWDDPLTPLPLREAINMDGDTYSVAFKDHYAYVADEINGCKILDISDPANPVLVNTISTRSHVYNLKVEADRLYFSAGDDGFYIADISNPAEPVQIGGYQSQLAVDELGQRFWGWVVDFKVEGNLAYLGVDITGIFAQFACVEVINIEDPSEIFPVGVEGFSGICNSIEKYGDTVLLVGLGQYLSMDVSDPAKPYYKGHFNIPGGGNQIALPELADPYGYIPAGSEGLKVVDFSDPANIGTLAESSVTNTVAVVASLPLSGYRNGISCRGEELLVGSYNKGFARVDISSNLVPRLVDQYKVAGRTRGAFFSEDGNLILTASAQSGVYLFEKETAPLEPPTIDSWGYNSTGDFVITLSPGAGNLQLEYSLDMQSWTVVEEASFQGRTVSISAQFLVDKKNVCFRVKEWR